MVNIESIFMQWDNLGLFSHILPFLLIFAVVYGIIFRMNLFGEQKGVQVIIALVIGLLSIRYRLLGDVLEIVSPRLGVGLVVILALLILIGMFVPQDAEGIMGWILMGVGLVIFIVILSQTAVFFDTGFGGYLGDEIIAYVVLAVLLIGIIVAVVVSGAEKETDPAKRMFKKIGKLFGS